MMTQNTAQAEAMQAVRLLRTHALTGDHTQATIETLYQASKLLEGFIEASHTSEPAPDDEDMTWSAQEQRWIRGRMTFYPDPKTDAKPAIAVTNYWTILDKKELRKALDDEFDKAFKSLWSQWLSK